MEPIVAKDERVIVGTLCRALSDEHRALEASFQALVKQVYRDDREEMTAAFNVMEQGLLTHLDMEEREILPRFAALHGDEAVRIRDEHAQIRRRLTDLGIALELHVLRAQMVDDFVQLLREHATREEKLMYEWSESALPSREKLALVHWILARIQEYFAISLASR